MSPTSMSSLRWRKRSLLASGPLFHILLLCGNSVLAAELPVGPSLAAQQTLVRNVGAEVETLDPSRIESMSAHTIVQDLFEGLTAMDNHGHVVPGVAEQWYQKDAHTWLFRLRQNARWSNGMPVQADDFVYGMQRLLDPQTASPNATTYGIFLLNGVEVVGGKKPVSALGVRALDAYTLQIKTPHPVPFLPAMLTSSNLVPINSAIVKRAGDQWTKPDHIVSNGAYRMKSWRVNDRIVLVKNPHYWDTKKVCLTQITYLPISDEDADVKMYQSGANDWVYQLPAGSYARMKDRYPKELQGSPILGLRYFSLNTEDALLKDVRVRKALSMVIDRPLLTQRVLADGQAPAYGLIVDGVHGADVDRYDWVSWPMQTRVAYAKRLLVSAGVVSGTTLKLAYNSSPYNKRMALFLASEWKRKLGLNTALEAMEVRVLMAKRHTGEYQIARDGIAADYNDASSFLSIVACHGQQNLARYCDAKAQGMLDQASASNDPAQRHSLQSHAIRQIMDGYPIIPIAQYGTRRLIKSYVGGYGDGNVFDRYRSKDLYILKH